MAARASNSFCTSATAAGVRAICASAFAASARIPTPSFSAGAINGIISGRSNRPIARIAVRRPLPFKRFVQRREARFGGRTRVLGLQHPLLQ